MTSKDLASVGSKVHAESTEAGILLDVNGKPSEVAFLLGSAIRYFAENVHENPLEVAMRLGILAQALDQGEKVTIDLGKMRRGEQK